jgi:hypothetical protein
MATPYNVPRDLNLQNIAAPSLVEGYETARGNTDMAAFTANATAFTNILNANRQQSLRERQFAQEMINADRNFQLTKDQQEYNFQAGQRDYDLKKEYQQAQLRNFDLNASQAQWTMQVQKENYDNAKEAMRLAPEWNDELKARLGAQGAYGPHADEIMADFILQKGTNPAFKNVLDQLIIPYKQQAQTYKSNSYDAVIAQAEAHNSRGDLDNIFFKDPDSEGGQEINGRYLLYKMQEARDKGDMYGLAAYKAKLELGLEDFNRQKEAKIQEEAFQRAARYGLPVGEIDVKGGVMAGKFVAPRVVKGTGGAGGAGGTGAERAFTETNITSVQKARDERDSSYASLKEADTALRAIDQNSAEFQVKKQERDEKLAEYNRWQNILEESTRRMSQEAAPVVPGQPQPTTKTQVPTTVPSTQAPSTTPTSIPRPSSILQGDKKAGVSISMPTNTNDAAEALLSPEAKRLQRGLQTVEMAATPVAQGLARTLVPAPIRAIPSALFGATSTAQTVAEVPKAVSELSAIRKLRERAQLAANTRADRGENPTVAYQEELQKLVTEYQARNQPQISVR